MTGRRRGRCQRGPSTADPAGPGLAVVVLGLTSAIAWGAGDFTGGWAGRRAPVLTIAIIVDIVGAIAMVGVAVAIGERFPGPATFALAALAGVFAVAGIVGLYTGLAVGRMGVVAPVTGVLAAVLPVVVGFVAQGVPPPAVLIGIVLALVAVVLVSASADTSGRRSGIEYGLIGGIGLGFFNVAIGAFPEHLVAWPLVIIKVASLVPIVLIVVLGRRDWRIPVAILPIVLVGAFADLAGNGLYILATQAGRRDVAAMLSSLYPVTTVILAVVLLHERVTNSHLVGILTAGIAVALIALGSTAPAA
jgi:drug/metabolite transporter (DMT)-like permease